MVKALSDFKDALINSKECDEILVARADFSDSATVGGYKRITEFDTSYSTDGCTAMYDTIIDGTEKLKEYRDFIKNEGMRVKAVFAIFGDGMDNSSQPGGFAKPLTERCYCGRPDGSTDICCDCHSTSQNLWIRI